MKRLVVIFLVLLYTVSTAGVTGINFYCCGKLKETSLFSSPRDKDGCKKDKKDDNCCDTKTFLVKVTDQHAPTLRQKVSADVLACLPPLHSSFIHFQQHEGSATVYIDSGPPLTYQQPLYLDHCTFRI